MEFFFYPQDENKFKQDAVGNFVRTIIFNSVNEKVATSFVRKVNKLWEQTCKNNVETDHRIKELSGEHFQVYSWITQSKNDFGLPNFAIK